MLFTCLANTNKRYILIQYTSHLANQNVFMTCSALIYRLIKQKLAKHFIQLLYQFPREVVIELTG